MKTPFIYLFLLSFLISCKGNDPASIKENLADEYAVINQTMAQLGNKLRKIKRGYYKPPCAAFNTDWDSFNKAYNQKERKIIIDRLLNKGVDTSNVCWTAIEVEIINDSLYELDSLKTNLLDITKLNIPKNIILITRSDSLYSSRWQHEGISFSRVLIDYKTNTARYQYSYSNGGLDGEGFEIFCEFKNGAWTIIESKQLWIS